MYELTVYLKHGSVSYRFTDFDFIPAKLLELKASGHIIVNYTYSKDG